MRARAWSRGRWIIGALLLTISLSPAGAEEEKEEVWSRAYRFEVYPAIAVLGGDKATGFDGEVAVETETTPVFGGGIGLNLNDHINLNTETFLGKMDLTGSLARGGSPDTNLDSMVWLWNVNLDYNILKSRLTPLVSGGVGFIMFDGTEAYVNETEFSYNLGVGGRWDITDRIALRVLYRWTWTTLTNADDPFLFDGAAASLIFMF